MSEVGVGVLTGKLALVTGGSRGIGRAIVKRLAADGAAVVFSFLRDQTAAEEVMAAAAGGAGRRSAKIVAVPLVQSREAHHPARPLHFPRGTGQPGWGRVLRVTGEPAC
jgi:NAD(P)-dependent dehydrogenase (short-subunit alcohol dehydrogenase family)